MRALLIRSFVVSLGALTLAACGGDDVSSDDQGSASGKNDEVDDEGDEEEEAVCSLGRSDTRTFVQFVSNDHVQFRCRGPGGQFVETACCRQQIDEFTFATGCPPQAKFNSESGSAKRCVEDQADDASENVDGELFVPTVCCEMLCDEQASWDDDTKTTCRNSQGQFHPHVCCAMNDDNRCGDAAFDETPDVNGFVHCRAQTGQFAGQFAPGACCMDTCFEQLTEREGEAIPLECVFPLEQECEGAAVDGNGTCRLDDGTFAKGLCCQGQDGLDVVRSDDCRTAELLGDDLQTAGCL